VLKGPEPTPVPSVVEKWNVVVIPHIPYFSLHLSLTRWSWRTGLTFGHKMANGLFLCPARILPYSLYHTNMSRTYRTGKYIVWHEEIVCCLKQDSYKTNEEDSQESGGCPHVKHAEPSKWNWKKVFLLVKAGIEHTQMETIHFHISCFYLF
jgi:hypothetical protein